MANTASTPVMVRLNPAQLEAIDEWRRKQDDLPSRPEAVRRLAEAGLEAAQKQGKAKSNGLT